MDLKKEDKSQKKSTGIFLFTDEKVFLLHTGGPFYAKKDEGAWTIPKGEMNSDEDPLSCAKREFKEETGIDLSNVSNSEFIELREVLTKTGKIVKAYALKTNGNERFIKSNTVKREYPRGSGRYLEFPECDRGEWFTFDDAKKKVFPYQRPLIEELEAICKKQQINLRK